MPSTKKIKIVRSIYQRLEAQSNQFEAIRMRNSTILNARFTAVERPNRTISVEIPITFQISSNIEIYWLRDQTPILSKFDIYQIYVNKVNIIKMTKQCKTFQQTNNNDYFYRSKIIFKTMKWQFNQVIINLSDKISLMVKIQVDGKEYELTEQQENVMKYIGQAKAIEQGGINITTIDQATFENILKILAKVNYQLEEPPKINDNVLENYVKKELVEEIGHLDPKAINNLYRAAHFLKIYPLRRSIAAVMACKVYIKPTLDQYKAKKVELGLAKELTTQNSKEYKERFPFMN